MADTHVTITGNLTDDPELKHTPNGNPVATFSPGRHRKGQGRRGLARRRHQLLPHHRLAAARRARRRLALEG